MTARTIKGHATVTTMTHATALGRLPPLAKYAQANAAASSDSISQVATGGEIEVNNKSAITKAATIAPGFHLGMRSNDRVERPTTTPLAACRASQPLVGTQGAAHDSPRSAPTRC